MNELKDCILGISHWRLKSASLSFFRRIFAAADLVLVFAFYLLILLQGGGPNEAFFEQVDPRVPETVAYTRDKDD